MSWIQKYTDDIQRQFQLPFMHIFSVFITYPNGYFNLSTTTEFRLVHETLVCKQFDNKKMY